ncbi:MAG: pyridoxal phosphate-dependent aminotransferase [Spirochaetales bacterium]|nr:pyridoxal phosphate-dependent aminotransferase [Spirochaetales bacterium]
MGQGAPEGCVSLGLGEPSWPLPASASRALAKAYGEGSTCPYGPNAGTPELRRALSAWLGSPEDTLMLAAGSQAALFALFQAWAGDGDEVLVPDPGFVTYPVLAAMAGAKALAYELADDGSLDAERFIATLDKATRAKLAVINHPANPTGVGASADALAKVARICQDRGVVLVSDEVYRDLYLENRHPGILDDGVRRGIVALGSMSKAFAAPGLRVGWALGDPDVLAPARLVHNAMTSCLSRPAQAAAVAILDEAQAVLDESRRQLRLRWDTFDASYRKMLSFLPPPVIPAGGFYHWMPLPREGLSDPVGFCMRVRDVGHVIVVPGVAFGARGAAFARLSWGGFPEDTIEGITRLAPYWRT